MDVISEAGGEMSLEKMKLKEAIVVEGRYDKNTLSQLVDGIIIETDGFGIFKDEEKMALLRLYAETRGLIVFTDADGAGFVIRNRIKAAIPAAQLRHAYTPDIYGKEKRKRVGSKEGKLGVEGMRPDVLRDCLLRAGAHILGADEQREAATIFGRVDFYEMGLNGGKESARKREQLALKLGLPTRISAAGLLAAVNELLATGRLDADEFRRMTGELSVGN